MAESQQVENFTISAFIPSQEQKAEPKEPVAPEPEKKEEVKAAPAAKPVPVEDSPEVKARRLGWRPIEKWVGDPEGWVDADEFLKRAPIYKELKKLKDENADLRKTVVISKDHVEKLVNSRVQRRLQELDEQRKEAISLGDVAKVEKIEGQMQEEVKSAQPPQPPGKFEVHPIAEKWMAEREWFSWEKEPEMARFAASYYGALGADGPNIVENLEKTEEAVKKAFPERFQKGNGNEPLHRASPVEPVESRSRSKARMTYSDLTDDEKRVCDRLVRQGALSREEYVKDIAEQRGLL